jgi:hypothetical protein
MGIMTEPRSVTSDVVHAIAGECDNCGQRLELKWGAMVTNGEIEDMKTIKEALPLMMHGSYGGYFDHPDTPVLLCKGCANSLLAEFPCFKRALDRWDLPREPKRSEAESQQKRQRSKR